VSPSGVSDLEAPFVITKGIIMSKTSVTYVPKTPDLPEWDYTVYVQAVGGLLDEVGVTAAYFQEQGSMLVFKDSEHTVVDGFRTETVLRVARGDEAVDDA
jgi:hypothetical protein